MIQSFQVPKRADKWQYAVGNVICSTILQQVRTSSPSPSRLEQHQQWPVIIACCARIGHFKFRSSGSFVHNSSSARMDHRNSQRNAANENCNQAPCVLVPHGRQSASWCPCSPHPPGRDHTTRFLLLLTTKILSSVSKPFQIQVLLNNFLLLSNADQTSYFFSCQVTVRNRNCC